MMGNDDEVPQRWAMAPKVLGKTLNLSVVVPSMTLNSSGVIEEMILRVLL